MDELGEKIKAMLADPKGVQAVMGIARALAGEGGAAPGAAPATESAPPASPEPAAVPTGGASQEGSPLKALLDHPQLKRLFGTDCDKRNRLLQAICPFLCPEKRRKLESILKATQTVQMLYSAGNLL